MNDLVPVTVFYGAHNLLEEPPCFIFRHLPVFNDVVEELVARKLQYHDDLVRCCYNSVSVPVSKFVTYAG